MRAPRVVDRAAFNLKTSQRASTRKKARNGGAAGRPRRRGEPTVEAIERASTLLGELLAVATYASDGTPMLRAIYAVRAERRDLIDMYAGMRNVFERLGTDVKHSLWPDPAHRLSYVQIVKLFGRGDRAFRTNFREFAGMSCLHHRAEWRLLSALLLFRKGSLSESEVADRVGLAPTCLSRAFGARFQMTPVQFRQKFRANLVGGVQTSVPEFR